MADPKEVVEAEVVEAEAQPEGYVPEEEGPEHPPRESAPPEEVAAAAVVEVRGQYRPPDGRMPPGRVETLPTRIPAGPGGSLSLIAHDSPEQFVEKAARIAGALSAVIEKQKLYSDIQGKKYVRVEGWTTLAVMLGLSPVEESNVAMPDGSFEATISLYDSAGSLKSRASAECGSEGDGNWGTRPSYARRSMAATRATSKACRLLLSWIITLAGYEATPAEEVPDGGFPGRGNTTRAAAPRQGAGTGGGGRTEGSAAPQCPKCGKRLMRSKFKDKQGDLGWYCWAKAKDPGCGASFKSYEVGEGGPGGAPSMKDVRRA